MTISVNENELLSAFIDGELQGGELDIVLNLLATHPEARKRLSRYQFGSDVLHEHYVMNQDLDLAQELGDTLASEPAYSTGKAVETITAQVIPLKQNFWKQATGLALAASISALAVVGVMNSSQNQTGIPLADAGNSNIQQVASAGGQRWTVGEPEVTEQLNTYLVDHNEYAGANGAFSYARVVSHDSE